MSVENAPRKNNVWEQFAEYMDMRRLRHSDKGSIVEICNHWEQCDGNLSPTDGPTLNTNVGKKHGGRIDNDPNSFTEF